MFAHAEVQASAHGHEEVGATMAEGLIKAIADTAVTAKGKQGNAPLSVVVIALVWPGFSDPNSVCSGACKGALMHINDLLRSGSIACAQTRSRSSNSRASTYGRRGRSL